jgi:hypothetical protein
MRDFSGRIANWLTFLLYVALATTALVGLL